MSASQPQNRENARYQTNSCPKTAGNLRSDFSPRYMSYEGKQGADKISGRKDCLDSHSPHLSVGSIIWPFTVT